MSTSSIAVKGPLIKTLIFATSTLMVLTLVAAQLGQWRFTSMSDYSAIFTNASEIGSGDPVLLNGVEVGKVSSIAVTRSSLAKVSFDVKDSVRLPIKTKAMIRYRNLTGDRYLELVPRAGGGPMMKDGDEIPVAMTKPSIDLDVLVGGLKPLFRGLDPDAINQFTKEIVTVLQGQGGNVESILAHVASFGRTIADRDQVIGETITNLNSVLANLDKNSDGLNSTIDEVQQVATALSKDRVRIGKSLESVDKLAASTGDLLTELRGPLGRTVEQLGRVSTQVNEGSGTLNQILEMLPGIYKRVGRLSSRGAGYSIYVCGLRAMIDGPNGKPIYLPWLGPDLRAARCQPDTAPLEMPADRAASTEGGS